MVLVRIALVLQWLRAARSDPARRATCRRYALGITLVQLLWIGIVLVPAALSVVAFVVLAVCELLVPTLAERSGQTPWHPHHIAERYGLFFIIVLGETILSATVALQQSTTGEHPTFEVAYVAIGGILIVFSLWWIYFARNTGQMLAAVHGRHTREEYLFGFGHYVIFASGAALGAGLAVRVDYWTHEGHASALVSAATVTVPAAVLLAAIWLLLLRREPRSTTALPFGVAIVLVLAATLTPVPELVAGVVCAALLAVEVRSAALSSVTTV